MLKLFKRIRVPAVAKKSVEQIIAEIHAEFDSASERILAESNNVPSTIIEKGDRLRNLGFSSAKPVVESHAEKVRQFQTQELAINVKYFKQWYPHNKFITREAVIEICKKYSLVFGDVRLYRGDVPEKNLAEMENFRLRLEDYQEETRGALGDTFVEPRSFYERWNSLVSRTNESEKVKPAFKICAPESDFETQRMQIVNHEITYSIPDPIVLQPVKGGFLIVTKWGLEASDDLVKNEIMN